jgi:hypothetical protein
MPYDRNKAAAYNKLIQQGVSEDEAITQAGISDADVGNYSIGDNGQLGPLVVGSGARSNEVIVRDQPPQSTYPQTAAKQVTSVTKTSTQTDSTTAVSGGGTTTIISGQPKAGPTTAAAQANATASQAELDQFIKDNPSNLARKRQGLPPLTPEENEAREAKRRELEDKVSNSNNQVTESKTPGVPTIIETPNTTTTTRTVVTQASVEKQPVQYTSDPELENNQEEAFDNADDTVDAATANNVEAATAPELQEPTGTDPVFTDLAEPVDPDADPELLGGPTEDAPFTDLAEPVDPDADPELVQLGGPQEEELVQLGGPTDVDPNADSEFGNLEAAQAAAAERAPDTVSPEDVQAGLDDAFANQSQEEDTEPRVFTAEDLGVETLSDEAILALQEQQALNRAALQSEDQVNANSEAAFRAKAKQQATIQARYKQPGNKDWRVRLSLGPGAKYLYNATPAGVLAPLAANGGTDGVIFPYTPSITTSYSANYEQYDLIHSNYRGLFYKNSRVGDIQLRGTFTAQNTTEANYLLATIHFFRSVTKMFYGQDAERGTPPPICLLNGFGGYQFSDHPVVISSFNYTLPNDVDYIRTTNPNNFGLDLNNRYNPAGSSLPAGGALSGLYRLLNAVPGGLSKGALPTVPAPNTVAGSVTNNVPASYVPTKMEIDITLIPVQSRSQVSQQFSLKGFANGDLLKGGFW